MTLINHKPNHIQSQFSDELFQYCIMPEQMDNAMAH